MNTTMLKKVRRFLYLILLWNGLFPLRSYSWNVVTLNEAINVWALHSNEARAAALRYRNELLSYANYRKGLLPSLSFQVSPVSLNHSLRQLQDALGGDYRYIDDYANSSSAGFTLQQSVGWTGGTLTAGSNVMFLREFSRNRNSFSTNVFTLGYSQPFWGGHRRFRLNDAAQHMANRLSVRNYCTEVSAAQRQALALYLDAFLYKLEHDLARRSLAIEDTLLRVAAVKRREGYLTAYDYNQVELQLLHTRFACEEAGRDYRTACRRLADYLGMADSVAVAEPSDTLPRVVDASLFLQQVRRNNPTALTQELQLLQADAAWYEADLATRFNGTVSLHYGLNQYAEHLADAYRRPINSQSVSVSLQIPVFQWGINRNKRRMAENKRQETQLEVETARRTFESSLYEQVDGYNSSASMTAIARRSYLLACDQYSLLVRKFALGSVSVYELTSARKEQHSALKQYYESLRRQYETYYALRHLALYDFVRQEDLADRYLSILR